MVTIIFVVVLIGLTSSCVGATLILKCCGLRWRSLTRVHYVICGRVVSICRGCIVVFVGIRMGVSVFGKRTVVGVGVGWRASVACAAVVTLAWSGCSLAPFELRGARRTCCCKRNCRLLLVDADCGRRWGRGSLSCVVVSPVRVVLSCGTLLF